MDYVEIVMRRKKKMKRTRDANGRFKPIHGKRHEPIYKIWSAMKRRCNSPKDKRYNNYGGRGITICDEWEKNFETFYEWSMKNGYKKGLTIDRIDCNGNYEPSNCRWVTTKVQNRNYSRNHKVTYEGNEYCIVELSEMFDIPYRRLLWRLNKGWSIEKALEKGDKRYGKNK